MNRRVRIIQLLLALFFSIVLFIFVAYAWFVTLEKTEPIIINTGSLRADCKFYRGIDSDYDGVLDEGAYEEITAAHLHFVNVIPGQIYTFKLSVTNIGTVSGFLSVTIDDIFSEEEELMEYFTVSFDVPETADIPLSASENGRLTLFEYFVLEPENTYDFVFQIRIGNFSGDIFHLKTLTIARFIVDLIQVHSV